jgi:Co/Zn/Cd efflux system component
MAGAYKPFWGVAMEQSIFRIKEMDCPAEEQMVRMKLVDVKNVKQLDFDLEKRTVAIIHEGGLDGITAALDSLKLGSSLAETAPYAGAVTTDNDRVDKKLLWAVLIINFSFFAIEILFGFFSGSMGLVADSLDQLSDAVVYGLSLYAITGTLLVKKRIARASGAFQLLLAVMGFAEVIRRFTGAEEIPNPFVMMIVSVFALLANAASLVILNKTRSKEVHIKSSIIFTSNDVLANIGVIIAGFLVMVLNTRIPDLVIGTIVFSFVLRGAIKIWKLSK